MKDPAGSADDSTEVLAGRIRDARTDGRLLQAPVRHALTRNDAYRVQSLVMAPRMSAAGGRAGWKLGYTSSVMREQMGIDDPNYGPLAGSMLLDSGAVLNAGVTQPRVEPEIAAVLARDVPSDATLEQVRSCVGEWRIALEVVDSVWEGYQFDWFLNTADGSSAAFVVLGDAIAAGSHLAEVEVDLHVNGTPVASGRADAAMGDPAMALLWLNEQLVRENECLRAGDTVITGGLTAAVPLGPEDVVSAFASVPGEQCTGQHVSVMVSRGRDAIA